MSGKKAYVNKERVALGEDISCRGFILSVMPAYTAGDPQMYQVQWDSRGAFLYLGEALVPEKEAIERQAKLDAEKAEKLAAEDAIKNKFKAMEAETK